MFFKAESHFASQFGMECWDIFYFWCWQRKCNSFETEKHNAWNLSSQFFFFAKLRRDTIQVTWVYLIWTIWQKFSEQLIDHTEQMRPEKNPTWFFDNPVKAPLGMASMFSPQKSQDLKNLPCAPNWAHQVLRENMQCRYSPIGSSMDCNAYVRRSPPRNTLLKECICAAYLLLGRLAALWLLLCLGLQTGTIDWPPLLLDDFLRRGW